MPGPGRASLGAAAFVAALACAPAAGAASFPCAKAATPVEKAVCADAALSRLDERLARSYGAARRVLDAGPLQESQRAWIAERDRCGADAACLRRHYERRVSVLGFGPDPDAPGPVDRFVGRYGDGRRAQAHVLRTGPASALVSLSDSEPTEARWVCDFQGAGTVEGGGARLVARSGGEAGYTLRAAGRGLEVGLDADAAPWCGFNGAISSPMRRLPRSGPRANMKRPLSAPA